MLLEGLLNISTNDALGSGVLRGVIVTELMLYRV